MLKKRKSMTSTTQLPLLPDEMVSHAEPAWTLELPSKPLPEPLAEISHDERDADRPPFGSWLIKQHQHRRDWIAGLAKVAKADHRFPKAGDVDQVRDYLGKQGADGDAFEALDDAEREWWSFGFACT